MKIYIDENIPYGKEFFAGFGDVHVFSGRMVSAEQLKDADILLVRSITQVNEKLLHLNTQLKFVGTATIGTDHIDLDYLRQRNISFSSAPGCNKVSVAQYVLSALLVLSENKQFKLADKSVAIVGAGNTGTAVYDCLTGLGVTCHLYDPPLKLAGDKRDFCEFSDVLNADIITLHVPKVKHGLYTTIHMFDHKVLDQLTSKQILINASRGEVIDNQALLSLSQQQKTAMLVLDVWENEPNVESALLPYTLLATPHIAGYSLDGKVRGTEMLYQAWCQLVAVEVQLKSSDFIPQAEISCIDVTQPVTTELLKSLVHLIYDVRRDDALFRKMVDQVDGFDQMRKNYPERRELSTLAINLPDTITHNSPTIDLQQIGFSVTNK